MINLKSIKSRLILFLSCFAVFLSIKDKDAAFLAATLVAVISALAVESTILYLKTKVFQITESSVITGLIVGFVLSSDQSPWRFILASALAILSKYLIRFRKKHIFNPAAFGILLSLVIFGAYTQWKGTYIWYILLPFGFYFAQQAAKIEILIGYALVSLALFGIKAVLQVGSALVSLALFGIQAVPQDVPLLSIFGYLSYFFIFIMVIEPKTTPIKPAQKFIFGASLAGLIFVLTEIGARFDVGLFSLLVMNATVPLFENFTAKKEITVEM